MSTNLECINCGHWMRHHGERGCNVVTGTVEMDLTDWHCECPVTGLTTMVSDLQSNDLDLIELRADANSYQDLRDAVAEFLNPVDDDIAEIAILRGAIQDAAEFIRGQPCTCTCEEPCRRCMAIGRVHDRPWDA